MMQAVTPEFVEIMTVSRMEWDHFEIAMDNLSYECN